MVTQSEEIFHSWFRAKTNENKFFVDFQKITHYSPHCDNSLLKDGVLIILKYSDLHQAEYLNVYVNSY